MANAIATGKISVNEYHEMIRTGQLTEDDPVELLEGQLVRKMPKDPPHSFSTKRIAKIFSALPKGWMIQTQEPITLAESEPEPDGAIIRGSDTDFQNRHPRASEVALVIEVANTSLDRDRADKSRIYARAGIAEYWIVNVSDEQVEVYTDPESSSPPCYRERKDYPRGSTLLLTLAPDQVLSVAVNDLLG